MSGLGLAQPSLQAAVDTSDYSEEEVEWRAGLGGEETEETQNESVMLSNKEIVQPSFGDNNDPAKVFLARRKKGKASNHLETRNLTDLLFSEAGPAG